MVAEKLYYVFNLGAQTISAASFSKNKSGGLVLNDYKITTLLGDPSAEAAYLPQIKLSVAELVSNMNMQKVNVNYCISAHSTFSRFVKLPPLTQEKVGQIVEFEARQNVPFPINEVIWDYQLLGNKSESEVEVGLVAIKADALNQLNNNFEDSGILTNIVDVAPFALVDRKSTRLNSSH